MDVPTYKNILQLWKAKESAVDQRNRSLLAAPESLRSNIERLLEVPGQWEQKGSPPRNYVEILNIAEPERHPASNLTKELITQEGVLPFAILFTLSDPDQSTEKLFPYIPVAAKMFGRFPKFNFWNECDHKVNSSMTWKDDREEFAAQVINRLYKAFDFDATGDSDPSKQIAFL